MLDSDPNVLVPIVITNLIALGLFYVGWKWSKAGRIVFGIIFLGASLINGYLLFSQPGIYLSYGENALAQGYKTFIYGLFAEHLRVFLGLIVFGQFLISLGLLFIRKIFLPAILGAILFLLAILPLGIGSAFPSTLIMALSVWIIARKEMKRWDIAESRNQNFK